HSTNLGHKTSPVRRGFHFVHRLWPAAGCYLLDLLRLRNMLATPASPAPMMAIQGVSLATAANNTRVNSLLAVGGGLRGRDNRMTSAQSSGGTSKTAPATA